jgi:hypothetical protein
LRHAADQPAAARTEEIWMKEQELEWAFVYWGVMAMVGIIFGILLAQL